MLVGRARRLLPFGVLVAVLMSASAIAAPNKHAVTATAPIVVAAGAGEVADTRATIGIALGRRDVQTRVYADYGTTTDYGRQTPEARVPPGDDVVAIYRMLAHLEPATTYHFRWVVRNDGGEVVGPDQTFSTSGAGQPGDTGEAVQGLFMTIAAASGKVRVRPAGRLRFKDVTARAEVAVNSVIDARHGKVELTSALPGGGEQSATFQGGRFQVRQTSADGRVDVHLRGGNFRRCRTRARASAGGPVAGTARKRKRRRRVVRSLWGEDSSGLYSTYGLNSVATVLGTRWKTVDRCDGTVTRVTEGAVEVRDRRTGATTLVEAGHSHLVRRVR